MDKDLLINRVIEILKLAEFKISDRCYIRPRSFDLAARRGDALLLLKILSNIDGFNEKTGVEVRRLAKYLMGQPLLIGEKTRDQPLVEGAVYFRYGVPTVSPETLEDCLVVGEPPLVYAAHGGLYVCIEGRLLRKLRLDRGISLGALAAELGVSRRTVSKYETESMDASIDVALKLEEIFDHALIRPVNIFPPPGIEDSVEEIEDRILQHLEEIGFQVFPTTQAPFDAISQDRNIVVLTGVSKFSSAMIKRAKLMSSLSAIAMTHSAVIIDGESKMERIEETALIKRSELENIDKTSEFADLVIEKRELRQN
jgi:putative transcriptional regulator